MYIYIYIYICIHIYIFAHTYLSYMCIGMYSCAASLGGAPRLALTTQLTYFRSALCLACPACSAAALQWCSAVFGDTRLFVSLSAECVFVCSASFQATKTARVQEVFLEETRGNKQCRENRPPLRAHCPLFRDFKDTVYPLFESDTVFLECCPCCC